MKQLYSLFDKLWQWISKKIFLRFQFDFPTQELHQKSRDGMLVFALAHGGVIDWLILSSWCRHNGLGAISIANRRGVLLLASPFDLVRLIFGRQTFSTLFQKKTDPGPRLLFVTGRERKKVFVPTPSEKILSDLYTASSATGKTHTISFNPVFILWRKHVRGESKKFHEYLFGLSSSPNLIGKLWYLLRRRTDSLVRALASFTFNQRGDESSELTDDSEPIRAARQARRRILVITEQAMRVVLGPRYHSPVTVKENVLRDPEVQAKIQELEKSEGINRKKLMAVAYKDLTEIVANYRHRTIEVLYVVLSWLFSKVSDGVDFKDPELARIREILKNRPVVFVPCHRSHFDYLIIPYLLFANDIVTPHIAAGINLAFWPLGRFLRSAGAFFIRRSFRGDKLYSMLLRKYIEYLLKNRYNVKFFIEGTRSRSGKMLAPAYGLLKMILETQPRKVCEDVALIPVSLCYEEVPEQSSYTRELRGEQKTQESAGALIRSRKVIKRNIGKVFVRFAPEISVKGVYHGAHEQKMDETLMLQKTAFQICKSINDVTPITAKSLVCSSILCSSMNNLSLDDILRQARGMASYVRQTGMELSAHSDTDFDRSVERAVRSLSRAGTLTSIESVPRTYGCDGRRRILLNFYKNNAMHLLVIPSITALSFLDAYESHGPTAPASLIRKNIHLNALNLRNWLKFDFFFSPTERFMVDLDGCLEFVFGKLDWDKVTAFDLAQAIDRSMPNPKDLSVYPRLVGEVFESYLTVVEFIRQNNSSRWDKKTVLQKLLKFGEAQLQANKIAFPESNSIQNYSNALLLCENLKLLSIEKENDKSVYVFTEWGASHESTAEDLKRILRLVQTNHRAILHPEEAI